MDAVMGGCTLSGGSAYAMITFPNRESYGHRA